MATVPERLPNPMGQDDFVLDNDLTTEEEVVYRMEGSETLLRLPMDLVQSELAKAE